MYAEVLVFPNLSFYFLLQGKYMDIEFDFKGDPIGGVITNCKWISCRGQVWDAVPAMNLN